MEVYPLGQYLQLKHQALPFIISDGVLPAEKKALLFGAPKIGKSLLLNQLVLSVGNGADWLGFKTVARRVLDLNFEISHTEWQKRWRRYSSAAKLPPRDDILVVSDLMGLKLDTPAGQAELDKVIVQHQPALVAIDPLYKVLSASTREATNVLVLLDFLDKMIAQYRVAVIIIAHRRKSRTTPSGQVIDLGAEELSGIGELVGWCDSVLWMVSVAKDKVRLEFQCRHAEKELLPINLQLNRAKAGFDVV